MPSSPARVLRCGPFFFVSGCQFNCARVQRWTGHTLRFGQWPQGSEVPFVIVSARLVACVPFPGESESAHLRTVSTVLHFSVISTCHLLWATYRSSTLRNGLNPHSYLMRWLTVVIPCTRMGKRAQREEVNCPRSRGPWVVQSGPRVFA